VKITAATTAIEQQQEQQERATRTTQQILAAKVTPYINYSFNKNSTHNNSKNTGDERHQHHKQ
jgi:hypothetical protein